MCGIWSDSDDHLTTDPRTFLYSILYSKKAAVEASTFSYTPLKHCLTAPYLYSSYTVYILYSASLCPFYGMAPATVSGYRSGGRRYA